MGLAPRLAVVALALALTAVPVVESPALAAPDPRESARRLIERATTLVAKAGRKADVAAALELLGELDAPADALAKFRDSCEKTLARASKVAPDVPSASKLLRQAAAALAPELDTLEDPQREILARRILRLDGRQETAHRTLGHVQHEGGWLPPEMPAALARRAELAEAGRAARRLPVEFETGESPLDSIERVTGTKARFVRSHGVTFHSSRLPVDKMERILGHSLRALALSEAARGRELAIPFVAPEVHFVLYGTEADYKKAIDESRKNGGLDETEAERARKLGGYYDRRGPAVGWRQAEADWEADVVYDLHTLVAEQTLGGFPQACLTAGHVNWVLLQFVGRTIPRISWIETETIPADRRKTSDQTIEDERIELMKLANASLTGARSWLQWLARRGEDPAWARSMVREIGKIQGNDLTKCTFVAEHLQETGRFESLYAMTRDAGEIQKAVEEVLGESLADYERRWRDWFLPDEPGLADRLDRPPPSEMTAEEKRFLAYLDGLRERAIWSRDVEILVPLKPDDALSAACLRHAVYLNRHRDQLAAWPDAHEEYPDREGFSADGCRAGLSSVIAPGVKSPEEAIDSWMATFYHRLPLLHPGLIRVGFGMDHGIAVLDAGSMAAPAGVGTFCVWPPPAGKDVPRRFDPELPNPLPGADQSEWGYPVTAQFFSWTEAPDVRIRLTLDGKDVDCLLSTPTAPTNPEHAPAGVFCLIPRQHLQPGATYEVRMDGVPQIAQFVWRFTTGK